MKYFIAVVLFTIIFYAFFAFANLDLLWLLQVDTWGQICTQSPDIFGSIHNYCVDAFGDIGRAFIFIMYFIGCAVSCVIANVYYKKPIFHNGH